MTPPPRSAETPTKLVGIYDPGPAPARCKRLIPIHRRAQIHAGDRGGFEPCEPCDPNGESVFDGLPRSGGEIIGLVVTTEAMAGEAQGLREAFACTVQLPEWKLHLAHLQLREERDLGNVMDVAMEGALSHLKRGHPEGRLEESDTILAIREGLTTLGIDPAATPPASELLLSDFLQAGRIPRGTLAWEFVAQLTVKSEAPWSVVDRDAIEPPLEWRLGESG